MLTKVSIQDFQSIRNADLEIGRVTFIIGPGDVGKSAIVRAIRAAVTNATGDDFIRRGSKSCSVELTFDDAHFLLWTKQPGKGGDYLLDGQSFDRTRGEVPEPIRNFLGIWPFEIETTFSIFPQMHDQFDGPFVVGESGSRIARIFGKLTKLDAIVTAQMMARKEVRAANNDAKAASEEQARHRTALAALPSEEILERCRDQIAEATALLEEGEQKCQSLTAAATLRLLLERSRAWPNWQTDVSGLHSDIDLVKTGLARMVKQASLAQNYNLAKAAVADASVKVAAATEKRNTTMSSYQTLCSTLGVCEVCPWR